ncbi:MAG: hypothetical protein ACK40V_04870 [Anaerolineales bacterium]
MKDDTICWMLWLNILFSFLFFFVDVVSMATVFFIAKGKRHQAYVYAGGYA